ncbi:hypothetical protein Pan216_02250 [Planctomycetes bacterium Pan216]|uniref:Uncharacterized protein n=1 Tax=Kolteria novifilia TaxID=2527975 RepID=A0A518AXE0_9BACT|nr:hypothetical protein Pan216_02250 [Planctomycetes bacterium Pan216]
MTTNQERTVREMSVRQDEKCLSLVLTFEIGTETVVEEIDLGEVAPNDVLPSLRAVVKQLKTSAAQAA